VTQAPQFDDLFRANLAELFLWRRDVRRFRRDALPDKLLQQFLSQACLSPSVGFSQPWRWVLVNDSERRAAVVANFQEANRMALAELNGARVAAYARLKLAGLEEAPVHLAVFVDPETALGHGLGRRTMPEMLPYSAVCAVHTLWLVARAHGVGMGWVSILDPAQIPLILNVPEHWKLVAYLCLGYPEEEHDQPELERENWAPRQAMEAMVVQR
jgi:5,6-dimethylbenzimidazole synthase